MWLCSVVYSCSVKVLSRVTFFLLDSVDVDCRTMTMSILIAGWVKGIKTFLLSSGPDPDPVLVHSRSILSHSNLFQFKIYGSGPGADAIFTVPPTHPGNFSGDNEDPKPIQTDF